MCRYALIGREYLTSYACIPCRHVAQFPAPFLDRPTAYRCPQCQSSLTHMGRDFQAPRKRNASGWVAVAAVIAQGKNYDSCGCNGPGPRPRTSAEVRQQAFVRPWAPRRAKARP